MASRSESVRVTGIDEYSSEEPGTDPVGGRSDQAATPESLPADHPAVSAEI